MRLRIVKFCLCGLAFLFCFIAAAFVGYKNGPPARPSLPRESTVSLLLKFYERNGCFPSDSIFSSDPRWYDLVWPLTWEARFRESLRREAGSWRIEYQPPSGPTEVRIFLIPNRPSQKSRLVLHLKDGIVLPLSDEAKGGNALPIQ